jgi:phage terminase large subunit
VIRLPNNWQPRHYQMPAWKAWEQGFKRELLVWHRRAGKDEIALHKAAVAAHTRIATYWHMLPEYSQARKAIWNAVNPHSGKRRIDEAFPLELRANTNDHEMFIRFKSGSTWQVVGSDNYNSLVGTPPAGIVASEWALADPTVWGYLAPILAENGGWASFITTPRGRNHVKTMLDAARKDPLWFTQVLTIDDTGSITRAAVEQQRKEYHSIYGEDQGNSLIEQEYWCSFEAAILGAYYGKEMGRVETEGRITRVAVDERYPVHTAWDLGVGDSMVLWFFQIIGAEVRVVDYYAAHGYGIAHYAKVKRERGYGYGNDYVPPDARVREMGSVDEDGLAKQRIEIMLEEGLKPVIVQAHKVDDGISAVRQILPRCVFDQERCADGLEALRQYRSDWDSKNKIFRTTPKHDWSSHPADAFRYLAMAYIDMTPTPPAPPPPPIEIAPPTYDELFASRAPKEDAW